MNTSNKRILYIGGFEMPDKNAAAQRVLSIAKSLRISGFETIFYGITKTGDIKGIVDGFEYNALQYPKGTLAWIRYALGEGIVERIKQWEPDIVITYNYPAFAQEKVIRYCHKNGIKVVGDITEWYMPTDIVRKVDTALRMQWSNKHLDGIIAISRYLNNYYKGNVTIQLPPMVDTDEPKWKQTEGIKKQQKKQLIYAGQPSFSKDRLDFIIKGIARIPHDSIILHIVGITLEQYTKIYGNEINVTELPIVFHGRLPHTDTVKLLMESDFQIFFRPNIRLNNAGFPTKFVESMSAGVPVIMNRISNVDDYLNDGINGIMIENPSESEIYEALKRVSNMSRDDADVMKANCARDAFDYRRYVRPLEEFMNKL